MLFVLVARRMFKSRADFTRYWEGGGGRNAECSAKRNWNGIGATLNILRRQSGCIDWTQRSTLFLEDENESPVPRTSFQMKIRIIDNVQKNYHCIEYSRRNPPPHTHTHTLQRRSVFKRFMCLRKKNRTYTRECRLYTAVLGVCA
jgi:hypothetical protein